ncbi:hypothetical protein E5206_07515 [Arthrobacter sp. PAMC25564]|uniref:hypothetical protein n=1 Tax=Arthrobacter sp. PAMC25564 TaxID=2565366 RepID=UPI0010A22A80|nr:hypothetical protein [Arthrobacter sp. PAMC25564]QCB98901.1 hypothetical protein E5206_07515 [Arthrobacter sp. PAMC25564]
MILVIAVALWIVWVAPYVLRNGRHQLQPAGDFLAEVIDLEPADPQAGKIMMMAQQEDPMTSTQRTGPVKRAADADAARKPAATGPAFRIRYGRLALALAGVLSLLAGVVSAALRIFGLGTAWLPVVTLLGAAGAVVLLRRLAVRDRRRKVNVAFRAAMSAPTPRSASAQSAQLRSAQAQPAQEPGAGVRSRDTREPVSRPESLLFDAQSGPGAPKAAPKALTAQELRQAAMAEAAASGDTSVRLSPEGSSWEPVEIPKPTYVEAAKAERAAPGPLDLPAAPKAVGKPSLKQGLVQGGSRTPASEAPAAVSDAKPGKAQSALSNLDDVLQRRRA